MAFNEREMTKRDAIAELRESGYTQNKIAENLNISIGAVSWYCTIDGLKGKVTYKKPKLKEKYKRGNIIVRSFTDEDDKVLLDLESKGLRYGTIGRLMGRNRNSVWARLAILARYEE